MHLRGIENTNFSYSTPPHFTGYRNSGVHMQGLGIDPVSALTTGFGLKNIFGIGAKKRALRDIESGGRGVWTSKFDPEIDWNEYLNKFGGAVRDSYNANRRKKDSILIKNQIASPEDFAAWHLSTIAIPDGYLQKNKGWIPRRFDGTLMTEPPKVARQAAPPTPSIKPPAPQPAATPPPAQRQDLLPREPAFNIADLFNIFGQQQPPPQPAQPAQPVQAPMPNWIVPVALVAGAGLLAVTMGGGKRKR